MGRGIRIDELARRARTTSRNVRAHQAKGLLPPPRLVGRVGFYDESHLERLHLIANLQTRGFSLAAIKAILDAWDEGAGVEEVLGFGKAVLAPYTEESPETLTRKALLALLPDLADQVLLDKVVALGILNREGTRFVAPSPRLLRIGAELVAAGIPLDKALGEVSLLFEQTRTIAARFVELFDVHVWQPFVEGGLPADELPRVAEALERVRPLASEVVSIFLARAMEAEVARVSAENLEKLSAMAEADAG